MGANLVPSIVDAVNTAKNYPNVPGGLGGLLDVLSYVFVAIILLAAVGRLAASKSDLSRITSQIRGTLKEFDSHANPELNSGLPDKCVETRWFVPLVGNGIVRHSMKVEVNCFAAG